MCLTHVVCICVMSLNTKVKDMVLCVLLMLCLTHVVCICVMSLNTKVKDKVSCVLLALYAFVTCHLIQRSRTRFLVLRVLCICDMSLNTKVKDKVSCVLLTWYAFVSCHLARSRTSLWTRLRKELFYLMMRSAHFIYSYMASEVMAKIIIHFRKIFNFTEHLNRDDMNTFGITNSFSWVFLFLSILFSK